MSGTWHSTFVNEHGTQRVCQTKYVPTLLPCVLAIRWISMAALILPENLLSAIKLSAPLETSQVWCIFSGNTTGRYCFCTATLKNALKLCCWTPTSIVAMAGSRDTAEVMLPTPLVTSLCTAHKPVQPALSVISEQLSACGCCDSGCQGSKQRFAGSLYNHLSPKDKADLHAVRQKIHAACARHNDAER